MGRRSAPVSIVPCPLAVAVERMLGPEVLLKLTSGLSGGTNAGGPHAAGKKVTKA